MLPTMNFSIQVLGAGVPKKGELVYEYGPFLNLIDRDYIENDRELPLKPLTLNSFDSGIEITKPLSLEVEASYDDSVNIIIVDGVNSPKIVNSRFYLPDSTHYEIPEKRVSLDTSVYSEDNFKVEASLIKTVRTISTLEFLGIKDGGNMPVGNYTFYFKFADVDGNESDFISESGKVVCHIGAVNSPSAIRGGQGNENSNKLIQFVLKNVDLAYDYIHIYYTRNTGDEVNKTTTAYKIQDRVRITGLDVPINISGYEVHTEISIDDINAQYVNFETAKTVANCQNITFLGNTSNNYDLFKTLEKLSLLITPEIVYDEEGIGNLNPDYSDYSGTSTEYYNVNNIYYKLGYWDEEIYRFGIVYILPDSTLSPVFNVRGIKELNSNTRFTPFNISMDIASDDNYNILNSSASSIENSKGVFKINSNDSSIGSGSMNEWDSIKPLGIKFNFTGYSKDGMGKYYRGLKDLTKGFFIVRQERIPTILAQAVGIKTSSLTNLPVFTGNSGQENLDTVINAPFLQSFLKSNYNEAGLTDQYFLGSRLISIPNDKTKNNALICPEASCREHLFASFFNGSEYVISKHKYQPKDFLSYFQSSDGKNFHNIHLIKSGKSPESFKSKVLFIAPGTELVSVGSDNKFSSKAGNPSIPYIFKDPIFGDFNDSNNGLNGKNEIQTHNAVRGEFNSYLGLSSSEVQEMCYYNIMEKNYDFDQYWKNYFLIRYNDSSSYYAVTDRIAWENSGDSVVAFRGDCFINTVTHRINWNFQDPEMPANKIIVDKYTWAKNIKIRNKKSVIINSDGQSTETTLVYNKLLPLFTYKDSYVQMWSGDTIDNDGFLGGIIEPENKRFKKYSEANGMFGSDKVNRPDINAVPLGIWVTLKVCSNVNLAMRDVDFSRPDEEAIHKVKRSFYPFNNMDRSIPLPDSTKINAGISKTTGDKKYFEIPEVPFIKTNFSTRIHYSNLLVKGVFDNGHRVFLAKNYLDYSREYGALVKLIEWRGSLLAIMEHGILMIPVNERAVVANESGKNVFINTSNVLPANPLVISSIIGSVWPESIIKTFRFVYGIDTVTKKIWRTDGSSLEIISDFKIQKFLNENIKIGELEKDRTVWINFVKSHFNIDKQDVLFTFKHGTKSWNICWNEVTSKWVTRYTWLPEFSENINNIFCTFANSESDSDLRNTLYYHKFPENLDESEFEQVEPAKWYGQQHPFEFEFIVADNPGVQKMFNNINIIANSAEPYSFYYEIIGDSYEFSSQKKLVDMLNDCELAVVEGVSMSGISTTTSEENVRSRYLRYLSNKTTVKKLPYIYKQPIDFNDVNSFFRHRGELSVPFSMNVLKDTNFRKNIKTGEISIISYQKGANIKKYGRLKGNMQYLEDVWSVQIQPLGISYAYINWDPRLPNTEQTLSFITFRDADIRDKYIRIRIKYTGDQLAIINALKTLYTISYA